MDISPTVKCYLKTTASGSWCSESPPTICWRTVWLLEARLQLRAWLCSSTVPTDHEKMEKAFSSTVWLPFMIVCRSVSWKFKQNCNLCKVWPWMGANFQEMAYLPLIWSARHSAERGQTLQWYRRWVQSILGSNGTLWKLFKLNCNFNSSNTMKPSFVYYTVWNIIILLKIFIYLFGHARS